MFRYQANPIYVRDSILPLLRGSKYEKSKYGKSMVKIVRDEVKRKTERREWNFVFWAATQNKVVASKQKETLSVPT